MKKLPFTYIIGIGLVVLLASCNTTQSKIEDFERLMDTQLVHFDSLSTTPLYTYQAEQAKADLDFMENNLARISELRGLTMEEPALIASIEAKFEQFTSKGSDIHQNAAHYQLDKILQENVDTTTTLESEMALVYPKLLKVPAFLENAKQLLDVPQVKHSEGCKEDMSTVFQRIKSRYIPMNPYLKTDPETRLHYLVACEQTNLAIKDFLAFLESKKLN